MPDLKQKALDAIVVGWCSEAILRELQETFYYLFEKDFMPFVCDFLIKHWVRTHSRPVSQLTASTTSPERNYED